MATPSFGLNPLDAERKRLERRRALVDILQKQALAGPQMPNVPGAQMSPYQGLAKMGEALIAALANRAQEKREKEFAGKELTQAKESAARTAKMLIPEGPDLGPAVTPTQGPVGGYAPIYAPEQQVAAPGGEMVSIGPALSRDISEQLSMPGQQNLSGTFAAQQQNQIGINAQTDARRNLLAQTIAAGGPEANFAITQQANANERAYAEQERKRREAVEANIRAEQAAEERSRIAAEISQRASEAAANRAQHEADRTLQKERAEKEALQNALQFKTLRQEHSMDQIAESARFNRQLNAQIKRDQQQADYQNRQLDNALAIALLGKGKGPSVTQQLATMKEIDFSDQAINASQKTIDDLNNLLSDTEGLKTVGTLFGKAQAMVPATDAFNFRNKLSSIIASSRVAGIQAIKGSGAVSNAEGEAASKFLTSLNPNSSLNEFKKAANEYIELSKKVINRNQTRKADYKKLLGDEDVDAVYDPTTGTWRPK